MNNKYVVSAGIAAMVLCTSTFAGVPEDMLAKYAAAAKTEFSATRGQTLYNQKFTSGEADTPSCTTCHGEDTKGPGRTLTGKVIDPVAISVSPKRYTKASKIEKWFRRNCTEVLGRECTPQEKGDWLTFVLSQ